MPSAQVTITQLPAAGSITGSELVPIVQNGLTVRTTTGAIANAPVQTQTFVTVNQEPTLPNSRALAGNNGVTVVDGGAQSTLSVQLTGAALDMLNAGAGVLVKPNSGSATTRIFQTSGTGLSITNPGGVAGNPTFALDGRAKALNDLSGSSGLVALTGANGATSVTIQGTAGQISVANGAGPGDPTISLESNPTIPGLEGAILPQGNSADRPVSPSLGQVRYNTQLLRFEGYTGSWQSFGSGDGTVTSVNASGGSTGLSFTGGPITSSGTLTLTGVPTLAANLQGGAANRIPYQSATDTTSFIVSPAVVDTYLKWNGSAYVWATLPGSGTVTSVALSLPSDFTVSGSPVTSSGTLSATWASQAGNLVLASPDGTSGTPSFRAIVAADVPTLNQNTTGNAATATTSTNIAGGAAGSIPYQTALNTTALLAAGSGVLVGGTTPSYSTSPSLTGTNFSSIPNAALSNSSITIGTTAISLGGTSTTLAGLTSVTLTQNPSNALEAATKQYVDGLVSSGITYHTPVKYEVPNTTGNLNATYNNGTAGVGATLTNAGTLAAFAPDGPTASPGDRILIYNQTNAFENGVYEVTTVGDGSTPWVMTRTTDADSYGLKDPNALGEGDAFFIQSGNTGAGETYVCNTSGTITFGTTAINFVQVSSSQVYSAGTGLTLTGTQFSLTNPVVTSLGGTGLASYTAGDTLYYSAGSTLNKLAIGTSTYIMTSSGSAPQWSDPAGVTVGNATNASTATNATTATNLAGGSANQLAYQTGAGATSFVAAPVTAGHYLKWNGSAFTWDVAGTGTVTSVDVSGGTTGLTTSGGPVTTSGTITLAGTLAAANGGTGQTSYGTGDLLYASGSTTLSKLNLGSSTYLLTSSGTAPQWSDPANVTVGVATNVATTATSTNADFYIPFVAASTTGNQALGVDAGITYNPSTNAMTSGISGGTF